MTLPLDSPLEPEPDPRSPDHGDALGDRAPADGSRRNEPAVEESLPAAQGTARRRIELLLDLGSFLEIGALVSHRCTDFGMDGRRVPGDGVVSGHGTIGGRGVYVYALEPSVFGGSLSEANAGKICKVMDLALENGKPVIGLHEGGGLRLEEGMRSLAGCGQVLTRTVASSGVVPQIAGVFGLCHDTPALVPAMADFLLLVDGRGALRMDPLHWDEAGSPSEFATPESRAVAHFVPSDDAGCLMLIRALLSYLPSNNGGAGSGPGTDRSDPDDRDEQEAGEGLAKLIPAHPRKPYDMRRLVKLLLDAGSFLEVQGHHARNLVIGFGRLDGRNIGVVANQPAELAGVLDVESSLKGARFVRFCDAFHIPLLSFVDVPGFLPGIHQEKGGIIKHGAKLIYAFAQATVPKLTVVVRKAYGGAYAVMASKHLRADANFAFPTAEIAVMGPEAAVRILYRKELAAPGEPGAVEERRARRVREYEERFASPFAAAELGFIDAVIEPRRARRHLIDALRGAGAKRQTVPAKKHGNIPL